MDLSAFGPGLQVRTHVSVAGDDDGEWRGGMTLLVRGMSPPPIRVRGNLPMAITCDINPLK